MPKNVNELRSLDVSTDKLPESAREILRFLGQEKGKAYDYTEIYEGLWAAGNLPVFTPWSPLVLSLRAMNLGVTLDNLNRQGLVDRAVEGNHAWFFLSDRGEQVSRSAPPRTA